MCTHIHIRIYIYTVEHTDTKIYVSKYVLNL